MLAGGIQTKLFIALLVLSLCLPAALASGNSSQSVEATTSISLPVDSVTIYPDGMMSVKRMGSLDVTEGQHKFVLDVPDAADKDTVLLSVTNATVERIVYQGNPVYTLNVSKTGMQKFVESYLMYNAGSWEPRYDLQLSNDSLKIAANAVVQNNGGQDLLNIKLKLVAGLPSTGSAIPGQRDSDGPKFCWCCRSCGACACGCTFALHIRRRQHRPA